MASDEILEDDDPVVGVAQKCVDCGVLASQVPVFEHETDSELRCDPCWVSSNEFARQHCGEPVDGPEEVFVNFHVRIGVKVRNKSDFEITRARVRALEVLTGFPLVDEEETWEHTLISAEDQEGSPLPDPEPLPRIQWPDFG